MQNDELSESRGLTDQELVAATRDGDQRAFREIVRRYQPIVAKTVCGMLGPGADADDAGQETMIRLHRSLSGFKGESSLKTYITRIAMNLSVDTLRKRKKSRWRFWESDDQPIDAHEATSYGVEQIDTQEQVRSALARLTPDYRSVVILRMLQGLSTQETAETLKVPLGTVLSRLARAKQQLKADLEEQLNEC